jgi:hypothetical protein
MPTIPHSSPVVSLRPVKASARGTADLDVEIWRTVARSETTGAEPNGAEPLRPARDPVNAGVSLPVAWAGRCQGCAAPTWAAVVPTRADLTRERRRCPACGGAAVFRPWLVWRQPPPAVPGTRLNGVLPGRVGWASADPQKQRGNDTGFITSGTPRTGARRGGRPRVYPVADPAARHRQAARAYRARRRVLIPESVA